MLVHAHLSPVVRSRLHTGGFYLQEGGNIDLVPLGARNLNCYVDLRVEKVRAKGFE